MRCVKEILIVTRQALVQPRIDCRIFGGRQCEMAGLDREDKHVGAGIGVGRAIDACRTDRERARDGLVLQRPAMRQSSRKCGDIWK